MKRFGVGAWSPIRHRGRCALLLAALVISADVFGFASDRRGWLVDQLSQEPITDSRGLHAYQINVGWTNYWDTSSLQATGLVNLNLFDVRLRASQRLFLAASDQGRAQKLNFDGEKTTVGMEIGRQYLSPAGHFGRLGLEVLRFLPRGQWTLRAGFDTGLIETATNPWRLTTQLHLYLEPPGGGSWYRVQARFLRRLSEKSTQSGFLLGGFFGWNYKAGPPPGLGEYEHMLFSFGPSLEYYNGPAILKVYMPLRLWLDKKGVLDARSNLTTQYPAEMTVPDITVSWTIAF